MSYNRASVDWQDAGGTQRTTYLNSASTCVNVLGDLQVISNASWLHFFEGEFFTRPSEIPLLGNGLGVGDIAAIEVIGTDLTSNRIFLPAPIDGIMQADNQTLDMSSVGIVALEVDAVGVLLVPWSSAFCVDLDAGWITRRSSGIREYLQISDFRTTYGLELVWVDYQGHTTATRLIQGSVTTQIATDLEALSECVITAYWAGEVHFNSSFGTSTNLYSGVDDYAEFVFADADGNRASVICPAPITDIFLADGSTVDPANSDVITLVGDCLSDLVVPSSGAPLDSFIMGRFRRRNRTGDR